MNTETYIYDGIEVVLTGKQAVRNVRKATKRREAREDIIYEIKPADNMQGDWTKWVRIEDMYVVVQDQPQEESDSDT